MEGSAVLSRLPILGNRSADITSPDPSPDSNRRVIAIVDVFHNELGVVQVRSGSIESNRQGDHARKGVTCVGREY